MEITQAPKEFAPITIVLMTVEEKGMLAMMGARMASDDQLTATARDFARNLYQTLDRMRE